MFLVRTRGGGVENVSDETKKKKHLKGLAGDGLKKNIFFYLKKFRGMGCQKTQFEGGSSEHHWKSQWKKKKEKKK